MDNNLLNGLNFTVLLTAGITYIGYVLKDMPKRIFDFIIERKSYSILIPSVDSAYYKLSKYLLEERKIKILNNNLLYNSNRDGNTINYGNYFFLIDKFTLGFCNALQRKNGQEAIDYLELKIIGLHQKEINNEMYHYINKENEEDSKLLPIWEGRMFKAKVPKRSFDTIFMKDKDKLINYIDSFISNKELYYSFGASFHTGILLYGVPGSGKSSIAKAIASYLNYDLIMINIGDCSTANDLKDQVSCISAKNVVLFEDIDTAVENREDNKGKNPILGALLNILDGVISPSEVVFVATTNYIERLDSALIRSGRFDYKVELNNFNKDLAEKCAIDMILHYLY